MCRMLLCRVLCVEYGVWSGGRRGGMGRMVCEGWCVKEGLCVKSGVCEGSV